MNDAERARGHDAASVCFGINAQCHVKLHPASSKSPFRLPSSPREAASHFDDQMTEARAEMTKPSLAACTLRCASSLAKGNFSCAVRWAGSKSLSPGVGWVQALPPRTQPSPPAAVPAHEAHSAHVQSGVGPLFVDACLSPLSATAGSWRWASFQRPCFLHAGIARRRAARACVPCLREPKRALHNLKQPCQSSGACAIIAIASFCSLTPMSASQTRGRHCGRQEEDEAQVVGCRGQGCCGHCRAKNGTCTQHVPPLPSAHRVLCFRPWCVRSGK